MPRKYIELVRPTQLKIGTILVDSWGNKRTVLKIRTDGKIQLTHRNSSIPGSVWTWQNLIKAGNRIRVV